MKKIILRTGVELFYKKNTDPMELSFLDENTRKVSTYTVNLKTFQIIKLLNGKNSLKEISKKLSISEKEVTVVINFLLKEKLVETIISDKESYLESEQNLFLKQILFSAGLGGSFRKGVLIQKNITKSTVVILGLGTIGTWIFEFLLRLGVSNFILIDPDVVSSTNIHRQSIFSIQDIGKLKIDAAKEKSKTILDGVNVKCFNLFISSSKKLEEVLGNEKIDLFICSADDPNVDKVNNHVSQFCVPGLIPHILCGGYDGHNSFIGPTVIPNKSACWKCYEKSIAKELNKFIHVDVVNFDTPKGTLACLGSLIASIHALEAFKILSKNIKPSMLNKKSEFNFFNYEIMNFNFDRNPNCILCSKLHKK